MKRTKSIIISSLSLAALFTTTSLIADDSANPMGISITTGIEAYEDSPSSSLSKGHGLSFIWDDLRYDQAYLANKSYIRARATYVYESDAERYDDDRYRHSGDVYFSYQRGISTFGQDDAYVLGIHGRFDGHYNSQQLEEFEQQATVGLAINRRFDDVNPYDMGFIVGLAYNEEEKDDDWPREELGHGEDVLNRSGYGYYFEWDNRYTFSHTGVQLFLKYSRYDGDWGYDSDQFYEKDTLSFGIAAPLANKNNIFKFTTTYIKRDYELDLIGFDDTLYRVDMSYIHYF